ncbi:hypothetical protein Jinkies_12 [Arthrobacter phage Jinkies]|uniref:Uncharacterized protein n=1 Tax=Arthrobacter phage Jinkies TaxID=2743903 RepID=A0A7S5WUM1_9CAUD|nr:hypothetical protein Jinkies_12 [Arthrobacter phage Jinkies]
MAVEQTAGTEWGVTVEEVSALAPHVTIGEAPDAPVDDTFYVPADRVISVNEVEGWIGDVAGRVSLRLANAGKITDAAQTAAIGKAAHDAVVNGAASYLVAAAHPVGQINDGAGYAALLWSRYETALEGAGTQLDAWLAEIAANPAEPVAPSYFFPAALFPDGKRF